MKIEIKHRYTGSILFEAEVANIKLAVELAVKSGVSLNRASLNGASLDHASLDRASLNGASLDHASLDRASLNGASLDRASLNGASLNGASLDHASLDRASLNGASLDHASLNGASLDHASLNGASLIKTTGINKYLSTPLLLLADQIGEIRMYKLVNQNNEGIYQGGIIYEEGNTYSVNDAVIDDTIQCAAGISLASLDWCIKEWKEGYRILIAEFTANDIAAIPIATDGKFRVHKCKVVGEKDLKELGLIKNKDATNAS